MRVLSKIIFYLLQDARKAERTYLLGRSQPPGSGGMSSRCIRKTIDAINPGRDAINRGRPKEAELLHWSWSSTGRLEKSSLTLTHLACGDGCKTTPAELKCVRTSTAL